MKTIVCILAPLLFIGCASNPTEIETTPTTEQRTEQAAKAKEVASLLDDGPADYFLLDPLSRWHSANAPLDLRPKILNWSIEGSAQVSGGALRDLRSALSRAISRGNPNISATCFSPRHALRVTKADGDIVIVICFECSKGFFKVGDKRISFELGGDEQPIFDEVAKTLGILTKQPNQRATDNDGAAPHRV